MRKLYLASFKYNTHKHGTPDFNIEYGELIVVTSDDVIKAKEFFPDYFKDDFPEAYTTAYIKANQFLKRNTPDAFNIGLTVGRTVDYPITDDVFEHN